MSKKEARKQLRCAYKQYRFEIRKTRLLNKQVKLDEALKSMGVTRKQIPILIKGRTQYIKVKKGL